MSSAGAVRQPPGDRLKFLAETVLAEAALLRTTDSRIFMVPMGPERAASLQHSFSGGRFAVLGIEAAPQRRVALDFGPFGRR